MQNQKNIFLNEITTREQNFFQFHDVYGGKRINVNIKVNNIPLIKIQAISSTINFSKEEKDDKLNIILVKRDGTAEMVDFTFARKYSIQRRKLIFSKLLERICLRIQEQRKEQFDTYEVIEVVVDLELELDELEKNFLEYNWDIAYAENIEAYMYDVHNSKLNDIRKTHVSDLMGTGITINSESLAYIDIMDNPYWKETKWFKLAFTLHSGQILYMILDILEPDPASIGYGHEENIKKYREFFGFDMEEIDEKQLKLNIISILRYHLENTKRSSIEIDTLYWAFYHYIKDHNI